MYPLNKKQRELKEILYMPENKKASLLKQLFKISIVHVLQSSSDKNLGTWLQCDLLVEMRIL